MKNRSYIWILLVLILALAGYFYFRTPTSEENGGTNGGTQIDTLPPQEGLPKEVEATRQKIYLLAKERDYGELAKAATYPNFSYSFGGPYPGGFAAFLKKSEATEGRSVLDIIPKLLAMPYSYQGGIYSWPGFFTKEPKDWTAEDVALMKTFLTDAQIENYRKFGGYMDYRLGIDSKGNWIYYIAGD